MKTAISLPDADFERFERIAARHGLNRSEFYRLAGQRFANELEDETEMTTLADAVMARAGQPSGDGAFLRASEAVQAPDDAW